MVRHGPGVIQGPDRSSRIRPPAKLRGSRGHRHRHFKRMKRSKRRPSRPYRRGLGGTRAADTRQVISPLQDGGWCRHAAGRTLRRNETPNDTTPNDTTPTAKPAGVITATVTEANSSIRPLRIESGGRECASSSLESELWLSPIREPAGPAIGPSRSSRPTPWRSHQAAVITGMRASREWPEAESRNRRLILCVR